MHLLGVSLSEQTCFTKCHMYTWSVAVHLQNKLNLSNNVPLIVLTSASENVLQIKNKCIF